MSKPIDRRLTQLERGAPGRQPTAADYIAILQRQPRNADEFALWERNLSPTEKAALVGSATDEQLEAIIRASGRPMPDLSGLSDEELERIMNGDRLWDS